MMPEELHGIMARIFNREIDFLDYRERNNWVEMYLGFDYV